MAKKILVVGSAGFIGANICRILKNKYKIHGVDNYLFGTSKNVFVDTTIADVKNLGVDYLNRFDIVISSFCSNIIFAGDNPDDTYKNNVLSALTCFNKFYGYIINLSTSSVYGNPKIIPTPEYEPEKTSNAYDTSKLIVEEFLKLRGNYTTLRLSNVYGEYHRPENKYSGVICKFIYNHLKGDQCVVYGNDTRDYTYVGDVVDAIDKCVFRGALNTEINIGTGKETSSKELLELIGVSSYVEKEPRNIDGISRRCLDISKAKELLGWKPNTTLSEGIEKTKQWIKENYFL